MLKTDFYVAMYYCIYNSLDMKTVPDAKQEPDKKQAIKGDC